MREKQRPNLTIYLTAEYTPALLNRLKAALLLEEPKTSISAALRVTLDGLLAKHGIKK